MSTAVRFFLACVIAVCLVGIGSPAVTVAVDPPPVAAGMRLRGVSFADIDTGLVVGEGILATDDGGESWYRQFAPAEDFAAVDMATPSSACAVGDAGTIVRTRDGGGSWASCVSGTSRALYDVDFVDASYGWAVGDGLTVLRTTDGGVTWIRCTPPSPTWPTRPILGVSFVDRTHGWICGPSLIAGDGFSDLYIAKTIDGGSTWTRCDNGPDQSGGGDDLWDYSGIDFVSTTVGWVTGGMPGTHKTTTAAAAWVKQPASGLTELDFRDAVRGVGTSKWGGTAQYTVDGGTTWNPSDLALGAVDPGEALFPGEVCMSSSTEAWTVAESYDWVGYEPRGLIAHSTNGGENWQTQESSTGPVFFLGGPTRYDTAVNTAKLTNASADTVVLATGRNYPDALAASGLAGVLDAPLLLTNSTLPTVVKDAIADLGATSVVIVGGPAAVSVDIQSELAADYDVERVQGQDRYETAANVARRMWTEGASAEEVFVVSGAEYADAASAAALSYAQGMPVLLVRPDQLPPATRQVLGEANPLHAYVVGGTAAVSELVASEMETDTLAVDVERVAAGTNRYDTSAKFALWASGRGWVEFSRVGIATGRNFPDALTGGALMGSTGQVLVLTDPSVLSWQTSALIEAQPVDEAWIMNDRGEGAVKDPVATRVAYLLR